MLARKNLFIDRVQDIDRNVEVSLLEFSGVTYEQCCCAGMWLLQTDPKTDATKSAKVAHCCLLPDAGVSINGGTPKWMAYNDL